MSPVRVSVMLSMAAAVSAMGVIGEVVNRCDDFVEMPTDCAKEPGCMVKNTWDCVPIPEEEGMVWLQHPEIPPVGTLPPFKPADTLVEGIPVNKPPLDLILGENTFLEKLPEFLKETDFHAVPAVQKNGGLKFQCPTGNPGMCDFFVAVFACAPCSHRINGGLPSILTVTNGWEARSCAPTMRILNDDDEYKMTIFRVRVAPGSFVESPRFLKNAKFVAVFSSKKPTEFCPLPVRAAGPFPSGKTCGSKCPFALPEPEEIL